MMRTTIDPFYILGIAVRTSNAHGKATTDISHLWARFFAEDIPSKITQRLQEDLYCLYTDYEKDHTMPYTTLLGYKVADLGAVPTGLTGAAVPGKTFEVFRASGKLSDGIVFREWTKIWNSNLNRAYSGDFEVYGEKSQDPEQAEVDIYIALH